MSKVSDTTRAICQMYAEGTRPKVIAETLQVDILKVYNARKLYPDLIAEYRGKNMDGTPLEKSAPVEPEPFAEEPEIVEEPAPVPAVELLPKKHSIAELFQQIDALKNENADLRKELECAYSNHADEQLMRVEAEKKLAETKTTAFNIDKEKVIANMKDIFSCVIDCIMKLR